LCKHSRNQLHLAAIAIKLLSMEKLDCPDLLLGTPNKNKLERVKLAKKENKPE